MDSSTSSKIALVLAGIAFLLMVCAEVLRVSHGRRIDFFHVLFGVGMLAFMIAIAGRGGRKS
ncbi:MAG: hypothetical protein H0U99_07260 [Chthoniobacterales bacterium]|nr:hypothetical protein [Chthoniobacterales bacterium]